MINRDLSAKDITIYALYLLGGWQNRIHTEDIALECFKLAPSLFSWIKYPQYPDIQPVRFALEKTGLLIKGESERSKKKESIGGWMLTDEGLEWIKNNKLRIEAQLGKSRPTGYRAAADRKLKTLIDSDAYKKFLKLREKADISFPEFAESLICTVNTSKKDINNRLDLLNSIAHKNNKEEIKDFINYCKGKFQNHLR
jgi:predicted CopG family antitoxin